MKRILMVTTRPVLVGCVALAVCLALASGATAAYKYVPDGDLSDWGLNIFSDVTPGSPTADVIDGQNTKYPSNVRGFGEAWDMEYLFFDDDPNYLYIAVVTSVPWTPGPGGQTNQPLGDLGLDINGDVADGTAPGEKTGLEYAVRLANPTTGDVVVNPTWSDVDYYGPSEPGYRQNSPWRAIAGTVIGSAVVGYTEDGNLENGLTYNGEPYYHTLMIEIAIPRDLLPPLLPGDEVYMHLTMRCGNDALNGPGTVDTWIPAPGAVLLAGIGAGLVGWMRRRTSLR